MAGWHIDANLDLTNGTFATVDLTGATIVSEIRPGTPDSASPNWHMPDKLTLHNVSAGALQEGDLQPRHARAEGLFRYYHWFIGFLLATALIASLSHGSVEFH